MTQDFGDFDGFLLLSERGHERRFHARPEQVERVVHGAWIERALVSVFCLETEPERPETIVLRRVDATDPGTISELPRHCVASPVSGLCAPG